jgi:predicted metal-binding membrane protein
MNLIWIAALTVFVLAEKVVPKGHRFGRIAGLLMISWGGWLFSFAL